MGYVSSLTDGVPDRPSIEHYVKIVRDKALLRGLISAASTAIARASDQSDLAEDVLSDAEAAIFQLSEKRIGRGFMGIQEIVKESFGSVDALLQRGQRITGLATHYTDLDEMTSGLQRSDLGESLIARPPRGRRSLARVSIMRIAWLPHSAKKDVPEESQNGDHDRLAYWRLTGTSQRRLRRTEKGGCVVAVRGSAV